MTTFAQESGGNPLSSLLFFLVLIVGMYLLLIRPQRARAKQLAAVQARVAPGTRVITTAGLHASVVAVDGDTTVLEIAPGVHCTFASQAIVRVVEDPVDDHTSADTGDGPAEPA